jgi:hypothetical protein
MSNAQRPSNHLTKKAACFAAVNLIAASTPKAENFFLDKGW